MRYIVEMVNKETILDIIEKSIDVVKCGNNYPKAIALREFNEEDYRTEFYGYGDYGRSVNPKTLPSPVGVLQQIQADAQQEIDYEGVERGALHDYSTNSFLPINMMLNGVEDWRERTEFIGYTVDGEYKLLISDDTLDGGRGGRVEVSVPQEVELLDSAIDRSPRVQTDTVVYRYGELPVDIQAGEHGVFKGYLSTSYNEWVAFDDIAEGGTWLRNPNWQNGVRYKQRIFVPTGTKGVVLNRHTGCMDWQSELLLGRGQRYVVLNVDNENLTADILLY